MKACFGQTIEKSAEPSPSSYEIRTLSIEDSTGVALRRPLSSDWECMCELLLCPSRE